MRFILILLLSIFTTGIVTANDIQNNELKSSIVCPEVSASEWQIEGDNTELAKSGCCSWHDGVCGCSGGRTQCCDGTTSPSCTCYGNMPVG